MDPTPSSPEAAATALPVATAVPTVGLGCVVFVSGAVLMALEIVGSRVLAPYFGTSIYVWGSLIGIFLAALSLGYVCGGRASDRWPSLRLLHGICLMVAAFIFSVPYLARPICQAFVPCGDRLGPLLAAVGLFFVPCVLMGMVSPLAIKLVAQDVQGIGATTGNLYALSTVGSIFGTMVTTFVLVPAVGTKFIIRLLGVAMAIVPLVGRSRPSE
jgi:predicted membrane-bound spermidine synthase